MLPYSDLPYFVVILLVALPVAVLGARGRPRPGWFLAATAVMAIVHFGPRPLFLGGRNVTELTAAAVYTALQLAVLGVFRRWRRGHRSPWVLALAVTASAAPLVVAKISGLLGPAAVGFLGISFVTFRALDVLITAGDRAELEVRPGTYLAYLWIPPTVSAGPIDRYRRFAPEYEQPPDRAAFIAGVDAGVALLFRGLLYKFVLAGLIEGQLLHRLDAAHGLAATVEYMYCYSGFLFFDFAGYSAIAIGIGRQFGITTPPNFDRPFLAANIAEFWSRWHMTLSNWFRDHIYMRFLMAATRGKWLGGNRVALTSVAFLLTFGSMGAWHGLAPRYLWYGLYHAVLLSIHQNASRPLRQRWPALTRSPAWRWVCIALTFNAVCFGFLIFSGRLG